MTVYENDLHLETQDRLLVLCSTSQTLELSKTMVFGHEPLQMLSVVSDAAWDLRGKQTLKGFVISTHGGLSISPPPPHYIP